MMKKQEEGKVLGWEVIYGVGVVRCAGGAPTPSISASYLEVA